MRILLLLPLLFLLNAETLLAQINVGSTRLTRLKPGKIESEHLQSLKEAKTLFLIRPSDEENREQWQTVLAEAWTINELIVVGYQDLDEYLQDPEQNYAILSIEGHAVSTERANGSTFNFNSHYYLHLRMFGDEIPYSKGELRRFQKQGETPPPRYEKITFARIELFPSGELIKDATQVRDNIHNDETSMDHMAFVINQAEIYNWGLGFIKNALQEVNRVLEADDDRWLFRSDDNHPSLSQLRRNTLYIPNHVLVRFNAFNANEDNRHDPEVLFEDYDFKHEFINNEDLDQMIIEAEEPFYYFNYIRSSTDAYYTVINALTGEIIYSVYDPTTYNIKPKNIKELSRSID